MKDNKKLSQVWANVNKEHRHLPRNDAVIKNEEYLHNSLINSKYKTSAFKNILDWGPGGGWLSKSLNPEKVFFFDIVPGFEDNIKKNFLNEDLNFYLLEEENLPEIKNNFDLAILYSVLYHMPSIEYVTKVINYIVKLEPNVITVRNIFTDEESWDQTIDAYNNDNYLRGNIFNKLDFLKLFENGGYEIKYEYKCRKLWETSTHKIDIIKKAYDLVIVLSK